MAMATNHDIINELKKSYAMELETVENYLANSIDLDGVRAHEIKKALAADIEEEFGHAHKVGIESRCSKAAFPARESWSAGSVICSHRRTAPM
jgi:bacterioferritin